LIVFFFICAFCYFQTLPLGVRLCTPSGNPSAKFETSDEFSLPLFSIHFSAPTFYFCKTTRTTNGRPYILFCKTTRTTNGRPYILYYIIRYKLLTLKNPRDKIKMYFKNYIFCRIFGGFNEAY